MGSPVWLWQILSERPEHTAKLYGELFGWKVAVDNPMGYRQVATGGGNGIDGGIWPAPPKAPNFVQPFMLVDGIDGPSRARSRSVRRCSSRRRRSPRATSRRSSSTRRACRSG
jgi:predicted enzyme related to lactoylglutathione lyase